MTTRKTSPDDEPYQQFSLQSLGGMSPLKLAKPMPPSEVQITLTLTETSLDDEIVLTRHYYKIEPDITYESVDKSLAYFFLQASGI